MEHFLCEYGKPYQHLYYIHESADINKCVIVTFIISKPVKYTLMILNYRPRDDLKSIIQPRQNFMNY